jgi:hypothetical protein
MPMKPYLLTLGALLCIGAWSPASSQQPVYKCWSRGSVVYTEKPCSRRVVSTDEAPVPVKPNPQDVDTKRLEQNRVLARSLRQRPDETAEQFETRRRRARMLAADRDECARLETRIPVEQARVKAPDSVEVKKAEAGLAEATKRFSDLRC